MNKPILIAVALLAIAAALFIVTRPEDTPSAPPITTAPEIPPPAPPSSPSSTAPTPPPVQADSPPEPIRIPKKFQDPHALDPAPLELNFDGPAFGRQKDNRILKKDIVDSMNDLNDENHETFEDIQMLTSLVGAYRTIFQQNPVAGENWELVEALTGKNSYNLVFIDPAHPAINADGELVDRWDVPYRFHPISAVHMEISSAGEDRQFGTNDDILIEEPVVFGEVDEPES
jgi:hypothetical protein